MDRFRFPLGLFLLGLVLWIFRPGFAGPYDAALANAVVKYGVGLVIVAWIAIDTAVQLTLLFVRSWRRMGKDLEDVGA